MHKTRSYRYYNIPQSLYTLPLGHKNRNAINTGCYYKPKKNPSQFTISATYSLHMSVKKETDGRIVSP